jgi:hypothetical protein
MVAEAMGAEVLILVEEGTAVGRLISAAAAVAACILRCRMVALVLAGDMRPLEVFADALRHPRGLPDPLFAAAR